MISSDHKVEHWGFAVAGGGTHDELKAAIDEAREMKLPIGFGEPSIQAVLMDAPVQRSSRGTKKSYKVPKSKKGRK